MLTLTEQTKVHLYTGPTDMRCGVHKLQVLVTEHFTRPAFDGALYMFVARNRKSIKILQWEDGGFWVHYKRLASSTFRIYKTKDGKEELTGVDLQKLLAGIDLKKLRLEKKVQEHLLTKRAI